MPNRFEQSAPPSIDKIYRNLPVGPFGVSPFIYQDREARQRRAASGILGRGILRYAQWLLQRLSTHRTQLDRMGRETASCRTI